MRHVVREGLQRFGEATEQHRPFPDFLIIGAQKAGTTALYQYLARHPQVRPAITKEVHYFDANFERGERWYRAHFPRRSASSWGRSGFLTGEATPFYLFHPWVPARVAEGLPGLKLIVMLRDPVRRAISHYYHEVSLGFETRSLPRALDEEPSMIVGEEYRLARGLPSSPAYQHRSYFSRGLYADQLQRWLAHVPKEQLLILPSERLSSDGGESYRSVLDFLGLPDDGQTTFGRVHQRAYPDPDPSIVRELNRRYRRPNDRLVELLGRVRADSFPWAVDSLVS